MKISSASKNKINYGIKDKLVMSIIYIILALFAVATIYPMVNTFAVSMSSNAAVLSGKVNILPVDIKLDAYKRIFSDSGFFRSMLNTVYLTVGGTATNMVATILAAYPLSKKYFPGKKAFMIMITITMFFGGGLIPTFILIRNLGMMNKLGALWIMGLLSTYNMVILRTSFQGLPDDFEEAAAIEGANDFVILIKIMLPMVVPVLATLALFFAVGWWNTFMQALLYISDPRKVTLMLKVRQILDVGFAKQNENDPYALKIVIAPESLKAAAIIVSILPILCVYPFLQRYFVKGVMIGSLKG